MTIGRTRGGSARVLACVLAAMFHAGAVTAADIGVVGLFPGKAVLVVDSAAPKTYAVGATVADGVKLTAVDEDAATLSVNGKPRVIAIGHHINRHVAGGGGSVTLQADSQGHYIAQGFINGGNIRMMVDTGATLITMPATDALRLGIDYRKGQPGTAITANGRVPMFRVKLDSVRIGNLELSQVDAAVQESGLTTVLLGMSFLSRTDLNRSGSQMTLTKRF